MCYFRHYNKSSNWYPFTGLETSFFVHQYCVIDNGMLHARPNCDQTLLHFKTIVHRLWYTPTSPEVIVANVLNLKPDF